MGRIWKAKGYFEVAVQVSYGLVDGNVMWFYFSQLYLYGLSPSFFIHSVDLFFFPQGESLPSQRFCQAADRHFFHSQYHSIEARHQCQETKQISNLSVYGQSVSALRFKMVFIYSCKKRSISAIVVIFTYLVSS